MKSRSLRRKAEIATRVRSNVREIDARIVNVSSRGLGLQAAYPPARGDHIDLRVDEDLIAARVIWTDEHCFGVRTQECIEVASIGRLDVLKIKIQARELCAIEPGSNRTVAIADASRSSARTMEFLFVAVLAAAAAVLGFDAVFQDLAGPLATVGAALNHR